MDASVPLRTSSPPFPDTVTVLRLPPTLPLKWRWLPLVPSRVKPFDSSTATTSLTFTTLLSFGGNFDE